MRQRRRAALALLGVVTCATASAGPAADIEYIAEHLAEVPMDNRYAALPLWSDASAPRGDSRRSWSASLLLQKTAAGGLEVAGPGLALALARTLGTRRELRSFAFYDALTLHGQADRRALDTRVASTPLPLPVLAEFTGLDGQLRHLGVGVAASRDSSRHRTRRWTAGVLVEDLELSGFALAYRIIAGPATGTRGRVDYDAHYRHATPFVGVEQIWSRGKWALMPHALLIVPFPRRAVRASISGPGFILQGDQNASGAKPAFGDAWIALGLDLSYRPWGLSVDIGSSLAQGTLDRYSHDGIDRVLTLHLSLRR